MLSDKWRRVKEQIGLPLTVYCLPNALRYFLCDLCTLCDKRLRLGFGKV